MKIHLEWQNQFGGWQHYGTMHHQPSAYRTAALKAKQGGKRWRLIDDDGHLLDLISPTHQP